MPVAVFPQETVPHWRPLSLPSGVSCPESVINPAPAGQPAARFVDRLPNYPSAGQAAAASHDGALRGVNPDGCAGLSEPPTAGEKAVLRGSERQWQAQPEPEPGREGQTSNVPAPPQAVRPENVRSRHNGDVNTLSSPGSSRSLASLSGVTTHRELLLPQTPASVHSDAKIDQKDRFGRQSSYTENSPE
ncbi:hypothetical protein CB1_001214002 [Camelus ferus]|nr:hypothetical protein CB1_001214002 [Camelus ferus]